MEQHQRHMTVISPREGAEGTFVHQQINPRRVTIIQFGRVKVTEASHPIGAALTVSKSVAWAMAGKWLSTRNGSCISMREGR